jgi:hypothetical protein
LANLKKCEFSQKSSVYLGYVIGGGEVKIDPTNIEAIIKLQVSTNVIEASIFFGIEKYLGKFISSFSKKIPPLHAIIMSNKIFQWGKNR